MNNHVLGMNSMPPNFPPGQPPVGMQQIQQPPLNPMGAPPHMIMQNMQGGMQGSMQGGMPPGMPPNMSMVGQPHQRQQQQQQQQQQHQQQLAQNPHHQQFAQNPHHQQLMQSMAGRNIPPQLNLNMMPVGVGMGMNPASMANPALQQQRATSSGSNAHATPASQIQGQQQHAHISQQPMVFSPTGFGPTASSPQNHQQMLQFQMVQQHLQKQQQHQGNQDPKKQQPKRSRGQQKQQQHHQQQLQQQRMQNQHRQLLQQQQQETRSKQEVANQQQLMQHHIQQQQQQQQRKPHSRDSSVTSPSRPMSSSSATQQPGGSMNNQSAQQAQLAMYVQMRQQQNRQLEQDHNMQVHHQKQSKSQQSLSLQQQQHQQLGQQRPQMQPNAGFTGTLPEATRRNSNQDMNQAMIVNETNINSQGRSNVQNMLQRQQMPALPHQMQQHQQQQQHQLQQQMMKQQMQQQMSMSQLRQSIKASDASVHSKNGGNGSVNSNPDTTLKHQMNVPGGATQMQKQQQAFNLGVNEKLPPNVTQLTTPLFNNMMAAKNQNLQNNMNMPRQKVPNRAESVRTAQSPRDSDPHHKLMKPKDAELLIDSLDWDEKVVYLSRHVMGGRKGNGYYRTLSQLKKLRKKIVKEKEAERKKKKNQKKATNDDSTVDGIDSVVKPKEELETLKRHPKIAQSMLAEMGLGITFCNTIASTVESILRDMEKSDTVNTVDTAYKGGEGSKQQKGKSMKIVPSTIQQPINPVEDKPTALTTPSLGPTNPQQMYSLQGATLRKDRDKKKGVMKMKDPLETMIDVSDEKKPTKKELAYRHFDATRYRTLKVGDYVLARPRSEEIWMLARIVQEWILPIALTDLMKMPKVSTQFAHSAMPQC